MDAAHIPAPQLGRILIAAGLLTEQQLADTLDEQAQTGRRLGEIIVERGFISGPALANALAEQHGGVLKTEYGFASGLGGVIARRAAAESGGVVSPLRPPDPSEFPPLRTAEPQPQPQPAGSYNEHPPVAPAQPAAPAVPEPEPVPPEQPLDPPPLLHPAEAPESQPPPPPAAVVPAAPPPPPPAPPQLIQEVLTPLDTSEQPEPEPQLRPSAEVTDPLPQPVDPPTGVVEREPELVALEQPLDPPPLLHPAESSESEHAAPIPASPPPAAVPVPVEEEPPAVHTPLHPEPTPEPTPPTEAEEPLPDPVDLRPGPTPCQEAPQAPVEPVLLTPPEPVLTAPPAPEPQPDSRLGPARDDRDELIESLRTRVEAQQRELADLRSRLDEQRAREDVQVHVWRDEQPVAPSPPQETENYLLCVPTTTGYVLLDRIGGLPTVGAVVEVPEEEGRFTVTKVVRLPRNGRPCAYLQRA